VATAPDVGPASDAALVGDVLEALHVGSVPERRAHSASYFPSSLEILGVPAPAIRRVLRPLARTLRNEPVERVLAVARSLVATNVHEARQVAWELVGGRADVVATLDAAAVRELGAGNDNWATVDGYSVYVAGPAWRDGRVRDQDVARWAHDPDRWWRRTALVATVALNLRSRGGGGDAPRTLAVCALLATDMEPMVAKALSWALRALVDVDGVAVRAFLARQGDAVPALVRREVGNKLTTGRKSGRRA
jgi:3-methyladenine DNA glycosylase AlkD